MNGIVPCSFYPFSSNLTGIISTNTVRIPLLLIVANIYLTYLQYRTEDAPSPGHAVTLSLTVVGVVSAIVPDHDAVVQVPLFNSNSTSRWKLKG